MCDALIQCNGSYMLAQQFPQKAMVAEQSKPIATASAEDSLNKMLEIATERLTTKRRKPYNKIREKPESNYTNGHWTAEERKIFDDAVKEHGRNWKKICQLIPTRSGAQIRSHAQKFYMEMADKSGSRAAGAVDDEETITVKGEEEEVPTKLVAIALSRIEAVEKIAVEDVKKSFKPLISCFGVNTTYADKVSELHSKLCQSK